MVARSSTNVGTSSGAAITTSARYGCRKGLTVGAGSALAVGLARRSATHGERAADQAEQEGGDHRGSDNAKQAERDQDDDGDGEQGEGHGRLA
jgi:hypothetical protein